MKESHSATIIFLLVAILLIMLFGASSVLMGAGSIVGIGIILAVVVGLLALLGGIIAFLANTISRFPAFLRRLPSFAAAFLRGWVRIISAPILGPVEYWRSIRDRRTNGERVNAAAAMIGVIYTCFVGVLLSFFAVWLPVLAVWGIASTLLARNAGQ
jgi:hypothetical protein